MLHCTPGTISCKITVLYIELKTKRILVECVKNYNLKPYKYNILSNIKHRRDKRYPKYKSVIPTLESCRMIGNTNNLGRILYYCGYIYIHIKYIIGT